MSTERIFGSSKAKPHSGHWIINQLQRLFGQKASEPSATELMAHMESVFGPIVIYNPYAADTKYRYAASAYFVDTVLIGDFGSTCSWRRKDQARSLNMREPCGHGKTNDDAIRNLWRELTLAKADREDYVIAVKQRTQSPNYQFGTPYHLFKYTDGHFIFDGEGAPFLPPDRFFHRNDERLLHEKALKTWEEAGYPYPSSPVSTPHKHAPTIVPQPIAQGERQIAPV